MMSKLFHLKADNYLYGWSGFQLFFYH